MVAPNGRPLIESQWLLSSARMVDGKKMVYWRSFGLS